MKGFSHIQEFWSVFRVHFWRSLKKAENAALVVEIGVDTADILAFWASCAVWYFDYILVFWPTANSNWKRKCFGLQAMHIDAPSVARRKTALLSGKGCAEENMEKRNSLHFAEFAVRSSSPNRPLRRPWSRIRARSSPPELRSCGYCYCKLSVGLVSSPGTAA